MKTGHPYVDVTDAKYYNTLYSVDKSQSDLWGASFVGQVRFYKFPFDTTKNSGEGTDIHLHPTFTVQGQTYQNVVELRLMVNEV